MFTSLGPVEVEAMRVFGLKQTLFTLAAVSAACLGIMGVVALGDDGIVVSQKNRRFDPSDITLAKDHTLVIVNDDGDLMHHAFIESDRFDFDSGDQKPGSRTPITFTVRGDFKVLCGIHPKMKLAVHVE